MNNKTTSPSNLVSRLNGLLLPTTTPFQSDLQIDKAALAENINSWMEAGVQGFVLLGSTGERVHLDEREFIELIEAARESVSAESAFIVGAGQQSTIGTIREVKSAAAAGADAVLVITPSFYRAAITQNVLVSYYNAVADASSVPVLLYSMPALTGIKIEPETIAQLSSHPNIIGVKDSSNNMDGFGETVRLCPTDFGVMTGNGTVFLDALKLGATGAILAVGCAAPKECLAIYDAFRNGDLATAEALQTKLTPFAAAVTTRFGIGGLKTAMTMAGYHGGNVREPLQMPNEEERREIAELRRC